MATLYYIDETGTTIEAWSTPYTRIALLWQQIAEYEYGFVAWVKYL